MTDTTAIVILAILVYSFGTIVGSQLDKKK